MLVVVRYEENRRGRDEESRFDMTEEPIEEKEVVQNNRL